MYGAAWHAQVLLSAGEEGLGRRGEATKGFCSTVGSYTSGAPAGPLFTVTGGTDRRKLTITKKMVVSTVLSTLPEYHRPPETMNLQARLTSFNLINKHKDETWDEGKNDELGLGHRQPFDGGDFSDDPKVLTNAYSGRSKVSRFKFQGIFGPKNGPTALWKTYGSH
ncbi:hypothetical protein B0H10DRAFT_1964831 [Mycena sp. CBHHK59/15]|nr:hypothetical protein B0H10DRAFT_1964831 [Mycena sp. CBHHK59/15]